MLSGFDQKLTRSQSIWVATFTLIPFTEEQKTHSGQVSSSSYPSTIRLAFASGDRFGAPVLNRFDTGELWSERVLWRERFALGRDSLVEKAILPNGTKRGHEMQTSENNIAVRFMMPDIVRKLVQIGLNEEGVLVKVLIAKTEVSAPISRTERAAVCEGHTIRF